MANVGDMDKRLGELADLEKELWSSFKKIEKDKIPSPFKLMLILKNSRLLSKEHLLHWAFNYPAWLFFSIVFGALTFSSFWFLIPYAIFLSFSFFSYGKYLKAYAKHRLGKSNYTDSGFGMPNLSLSAVETIKQAGGSALNKNTIASIIKIVKASQDYRDVHFGVAEQMKKAMYAAPIPLIYAILANQEEISKYVDFLVPKIQGNTAALIFLIYTAFCIAYLFYEIIVGQTLEKRRKKRYLLLLNIIGESFR